MKLTTFFYCDGAKSLVTTFNSKMWLFTRTTKLALISSLITIQILDVIQIFLVFTNPIMQTGDNILSVMEPTSQQCLFYQYRIDCTYVAVPSVLILISVWTQKNTKSARGSIWRFRNVLNEPLRDSLVSRFVLFFWAHHTRMRYFITSKAKIWIHWVCLQNFHGWQTRVWNDEAKPTDLHKCRRSYG